MSTPVNSISPKLARNARNADPIGITRPTGVASDLYRNGPKSGRLSHAGGFRLNTSIVPIIAPHTFAAEKNIVTPSFFQLRFINGNAAPKYMTNKI